MQHELHRVPVIALAFFRPSIILAGEGNYLRAYTTGSISLGNWRIFDSQAIHGIVLDHEDGSRAFVYGGAYFRTLFFRHSNNGQLQVDLGPLHDAGDWILDSSFLPNADDAIDQHASMITAHNALHLAKLERHQYTEISSRSPVIVRCLVSRSNCVLYSAHSLWLSASHCLIASGTAFGDIILWSAFLSDNDGTYSAQTQIHYTFSAHEGSIFGVQISPKLTLPGSEQESRLLASCSDDRNIKLWDISDLTLESPTLAEMQRVTGFGATEQKAGVAPFCLAKVMGHTSRIWQVRFVDEGTNALRNMRSFGEDASIITWRLSPTSDRPTYDLEKISMIAAHSGKNIWAFAKDNSGGLTTGGADGAIALYSHASLLDDSIPAVEVHIDAAERVGNLRTYAFINNDTIISTTDQGSVVQVDVRHDDSGENMANTATCMPSLRGFSMIATVPGTAFIAGANGSVYGHLLGAKDMMNIVSGDGKPGGLFACQCSDQHTALLITTVGSSTTRMLLLEIDIESRQMRTVQETTLRLPADFIVTSFTALVMASKLRAIIGSRTGSLAVYDVLQSVERDAIEASQLHSLVHGKEGITHLQIFAEDGHGNALWLFSSGRDSALAIHRVSFRDEFMELSLVHHLSLPFGPNVEGFTQLEGRKLLAWGFKSKHFIVYDLLAHREVMSVDCGGAHRNWAFQPNDAGGTFIWTKASKVYQVTQTQLPYELLNAGGHGREIKSVAIASSKPQIIATGAEDTDIKLHRLEHGRFRCLQTLRKHNTGIQCLQWTASGQYLFSSGGFEEFFVWKLTLGIPYLEVGVVCESKHPRSGTSDLRIVGFDVHENASSQLNSSRFIITMAYSDSTTKVWSFENEIWRLMATGDYLTACLTHVLGTSTSDSRFMTAATDGYLADWRIDSSIRSKLSWTYRHKVHQSAVHAVSTSKLDDGSTLIVSGGDDNAIGITRIEHEQQLSHAKTILLPRAHAAAVTGLVFIPVAASTFWLVSASIDQRVKLWQVNVDLRRSDVDAIEVKLLQNVHTVVADVSSLDICTLEDGEIGVLVSGVGMDVWRLPPAPTG